MKLNLGSHSKIIKGDYLNVDALDLPNVDIVCRLDKTPWNFYYKHNDVNEFPLENTVDEIVMIEVLEHISWRESVNVLRECYRILKPGGKLHIQVPDIERMIFAYENKQICECVPHKPKNVADAKAKLDCPNCEGYGVVNPMRWKMAFLGAQKHEFDAHLNIFTPESLELDIENAGFDKIDFSSDDYGWKIKVNCFK